MVTVAAFAALQAPATAAGAELAEDVSRLRTEVNELAHRLAAERRRIQDTLAALRVERAELERQLRLERIRAETLARLERERQRRVQVLETESEARLEPLRQAVQVAKRHVERSLPFRRQARLRALTSIQTNLAQLRPSSGDALSRLWRFVEEEDEMTRELGLSQQPVILEGQKQLVDVARVSMALLYVRTVGGNPGLALRTPSDPNGWVFEIISDAEARAAILGVFEAFEENRRFGRHRLLIPASNWEAFQ